jgi:hypothetical protein
MLINLTCSNIYILNLEIGDTSLAACRFERSAWRVNFNTIVSTGHIIISCPLDLQYKRIIHLAFGLPAVV